MSLEAFTKVSEATRLLVDQGFSERAVEKSLELVGKALGVDRAQVFENGTGSTAFQRLSHVKYAWSTVAVDGLARQGLPVVDKVQPWVETLSRGHVVWELVKDVPVAVKALLEAQGVQSVLLCPLQLNGQWWGFLRVDDCQKGRRWTAEEVAAVKMLARSLSGALQQEVRKAQLQKTQAQLEGVMQRFAASVR